MKVAEGSVVSIHYTLTNDAGEVLDTSDGGDPLNYLHGHGGLIPGLERELEDREANDSLKVSIAPEDAYGQPNRDLIHEVPLDALAQIENLTQGMQLQSQDEQGRTYTLTVDALSDTHATLNANHALAGQTLHFDVTIASVRAATEEELSHGHAH